MRGTLLGIFVASISCLLAPGDAYSSPIQSAVGDFSTTTNTNSSAWSYRTKTSNTRDGNYSLLPNFVPVGDSVSPGPKPNVWSAVVGGAPAYVGVNTTGSTQTLSGSATWLNGEMNVHPIDNGLVVVSWLAPLSGFVSIDFSFADRDGSGGNGIDWFVEVNDLNQTLASGFLTGSGVTTGVLSLGGVFLSANDRLNFIVDSKGNKGADSTALSADLNFSPVPEPSSIVLLLTGTVGLGCVCYRRRKNNR